MDLSFMILWTLCIVGASLSLFKHFFWDPAAVSRTLQGARLAVLPYRLLVGSVPQLKRLRDQAASLILDSPSNHDIAPLVLPFYTHVSSQTGLPFVYWWGSQPRLVLSNPDDIKQILSNRFKDYKRSRFTFNFLGRLLGVGLLTSEGKDWHNQRTILRHAFFPEKLKGMVEAMSASAMEMAQSWERIVREKKGQAEVEVAHDIKDTMADIIARTSFGSSYEKGKAVFEKQVQLVQLMMNDMVANSTVPGYKYIPTPTNLQCWKLERSIERDLRQIVEARRALWSSCKGGLNNFYGEDLLGMILASEEQIDARRMRLTTTQVVDECKTFFFAGHETTSHLLAWTMVLLGHYTEWQERARVEVLEQLGGGEPPMNADDLAKLKIMGMILHECLRLYSPVPELGPRVVASNERESLQLASLNGLRVPQGMSFAIPVLLLHRDKALWGDDADKFRPERFSEGGATRACKHPCAYLPFGFGPRTCIGQNFALMEAKVVMATILKRFRFRLSPNYRHAPLTALTVRPRYGVPVILESLHTNPVS